MEKSGILLKVLLSIFIVLIIVMFTFIGIFIKRNYLNTDKKIKNNKIKSKNDNKKKIKK